MSQIKSSRKKWKAIEVVGLFLVILSFILGNNSSSGSSIYYDWYTRLVWYLGYNI